MTYNLLNLLACGSARWLEFTWSQLGWAPGSGSGLDLLCVSRSGAQVGCSGHPEYVLLMVIAEMQVGR